MKLNRLFATLLASGSMIFAGGAALAQDAQSNDAAPVRTTQVELMGVECRPEESGELRAQLNNFRTVRAQVNIIDVEEGHAGRGEIREYRFGDRNLNLNVSQLEQLAATASAQEGQNIYQEALDQLRSAQAACQQARADYLAEQNQQVIDEARGETQRPRPLPQP